MPPLSSKDKEELGRILNGSGVTELLDYLTRLCNEHTPSRTDVWNEWTEAYNKLKQEATTLNDVIHTEGTYGGKLTDEDADVTRIAYNMWDNVEEQAEAVSETARNVWVKQWITHWIETEGTFWANLQKRIPTRTTTLDLAWTRLTIWQTVRHRLKARL